MTARTDGAGAGTFTYDAGGRLASVVDPLTGKTATYTYTSTGDLASVSDGAAQPGHSYTYDSLRRVVTDTQNTATGGVAASTSYGYDNDGLLTSRNTVGYAGAGTNTYGYDGLSRLTAWTKPDTTQVSYGYDAASNRTSVIDATGTRTTGYDARNRLVSASGAGLPAQTWTWTATPSNE